MMRLLNSLWKVDSVGLSLEERKRVRLTSQLSLLYAFSLSCFSALDFLVWYTVPLPSHSIGILLSFLVIFLNKKGYHLSAKIVLTIAVNAEAILFTYILDRDLSIFIFSICINIGTLAVYGYSQIRLALVLILLSTLCFYVAMFYPHERLSVPALDYVDHNLMAVFGISNIASVAIVYYFLKVHFKAETSLIKKENDLSRKHEELKEVNAELDKFFYRVSHDLRAPLASLQGLIDLMSRPDFERSDLSIYLTMMKGRTDNLELFVRKIAEYSRNSRQSVTLEPLKLKQVIRENIENFTYYPNMEKIKVIIDISETTELLSDAVRLQIIFGNLISNAIKYHDLSKPKPYIRISDRIDDGNLYIDIEDNGMGISSENLPEIFSMFYRANDKAEGTGLGLYIVKDAIEKLNGTIEVTSQFGVGTKFTLTLSVVNSSVSQLSAQIKIPFE